MTETQPSPQGQESEALEQTRASAQRIQDFDVEQLPRLEELGSAFAFDEAIPPARRLIELFLQIPEAHLYTLPDNQLKAIKQQCDSLYQLFDQIIKFDPANTENAKDKRKSLIDQLESSYDKYFNNLSPIISYLYTRLQDFPALELQARAAVQNAQDEAKKLTSDLEKHAAHAQQILSTIQQIAAEQGVSQQASYFKAEADEHEKQSEEWKMYTIILTVTIFILAIASLYFHKLPGLELRDIYQSAQIAVSKVLIFAVLGYMLVLCARNFLAHRHNSVVNRHRQNALLTYRSLVEAAGDENKNIILTHAAGCIFSPQDTGYTKSPSQSDSSTTTSLLPYALRE